MSAVFEWRDAIRRPAPGHELKPTERLVAFVLSFYMDKDSLEDARPGPARLASETGLAPRTVKSALAALERAGWTVQTTKGGTRKGGSAKVASTYKGVLLTSDERAPVQEEHGSTRAGNARVPVQETTDTRAGDAHHLVPDLAHTSGGSVPDLVELASTLCSQPSDPCARRGEVMVKLARFQRSHGGDAVLEALEQFAFEGYRFGFARELIAELEAALPASVHALPEEKATYPNPYDLDDDGNLIRVAP